MLIEIQRKLVLRTRAAHCHLGGEKVEEMFRQDRNVLPAFAQRRRYNREAGKPEVEILSKAPAAILACRSTFVAAMTRTSTRFGCASADWRHHAILQHAQQLRLQRARHVTDLIQEKRAAVGQFEIPLAVRRRSGERRLSSGRRTSTPPTRQGSPRNSRRRTAPVARCRHMDGARDQLLACAAFAGEQHARLAELLQLPYILQDLAHSSCFCR